MIHDRQNRAVCAAAGCDSRYQRTNILRIFMTQILIVSEASVVAHAGQHRAAGVADAGGGSRQLLFASVYETFCKYCKGCYDNNPYCFRLKSSSSIILRSRSLSRSKWFSKESYFGSYNGSDSDESIPKVA